MKKLNVTTTTKLEKRVKSMINNQASDYDSVENFLNDLLSSGCQSGIIGNLIYYNDTVKFYKTYKTDIQNLLTELLNDCGFKSPTELFGDKWDNEDIFANDIQNQNLLTWFGFEETARQLANKAGIEI